MPSPSANINTQYVFYVYSKYSNYTQNILIILNFFEYTQKWDFTNKFAPFWVLKQIKYTYLKCFDFTLKIWYTKSKFCASR